MERQDIVRTNLVVPFAEKDKAKKLGARWDPANKVWYVENVEKLEAFAEWIPEPGGKAAPVAKRPAPATRSTTTVTAGARKAPVAPVNEVALLDCDCLPWVGCEKCQPVLKTMGWG